MAENKAKTPIVLSLSLFKTCGCFQVLLKSRGTVEEQIVGGSQTTPLAPTNSL